MDNREEMKDELNTLGKQFAERFNMLARQLEYADDIEHFNLLPTVKNLDELDEFGRTLTTGEVFKRASAPDRASLAEVRCTISDAVMFARAMDYDNARASMESAMFKLMRVRDRKRTKALIPEVESALLEAASMVVEVITMFESAEKAFGNGEVFAS